MKINQKSRRRFSPPRFFGAGFFVRPPEPWKTMAAHLTLITGLANLLSARFRRRTFKMRHVHFLVNNKAG
jgi:hypothetical protein